MSTPARLQYLRFKAQYPDAILFYRLGDFYEMFDDDARIGARELDLTLTGRDFAKGERVPMAGVPHHALETYVARLVVKGFKVAVCEQMSDPRAARGLVDREIVRVITPGTVTELGALDAKRNNYLAALAPGQGQAGFAWVDVTTGEFTTSQLRGADALALLERELCRVAPAECLWPAPRRPRTPVPGADEEVGPPPLHGPPGCHMSPQDAHLFALPAAMRLLRDHYGLATLDGEAWGHLPLAIAAAGALLAYLRETQRSLVPQLRPLTLRGDDEFMALDATTRRNLELTRTMAGEAGDGSLISVLDRTATPMGSRLLRRWLGQPLRHVAPLRRRHDAVEALLRSVGDRLAVAQALGPIGDIERLTGRVLQGAAGPRDLLALARALPRAADLASATARLLDGHGGEQGEHDAPLDHLAPTLATLHGGLDPCPDVCAAVTAALGDNPPAAIGDGDTIRPGYSPKLDAIHGSVSGARQWMAGLEATERERTGIKGLRVGYNRVFGYYIEISNAYRGDLPPTYTRKQTLTNAERYITPELKRNEELILNAQERILKLEAQLFAALREQVAGHAARLLGTAEAIAGLDAYCSLATVAAENRYTRPEVDESGALEIVGGRHPVVEVTRREDPFVPNDVLLDPDEGQVVVLTGPNMAGKSTYLRQIALITLLAQIGSFVPAERARIGVVDRIFTRVGAQDDLATGQSTFMVEMVETAAILRQMTGRSLLILDEIGRGTSTLDGLAIAQAVVEHLHNNPRARPKTVFATHYHELTALAEALPRLRNYRMDVLEEGDGIVFLRKVVAGGADKSYGIHVAELAGLPPGVIRRARAVLRALEERAESAAGGRGRRGHPSGQLPLLNLIDLAPPAEEAAEEPPPPDTAQAAATLALAADLAALDVLNMTPLQALQALSDLQARASAHLADSPPAQLRSTQAH